MLAGPASQCSADGEDDLSDHDGFLFGHVERLDDEIGAKGLVVLGFDDSGHPQVSGGCFHQPADRPIGARNERSEVGAVAVDEPVAKGGI